MRKTLLFAGCFLAGLLANPATAASGPTLNRQVATALRIARHAQSTARAALSASERIPVSVQGIPGPKGDTGLEGLTGAQGPQGEQGPAGAQGAAGQSVKAFGHVTMVAN